MALVDLTLKSVVDREKLMLNFCASGFGLWPLPMLNVSCSGLRQSVPTTSHFAFALDASFRYPCLSCIVTSADFTVANTMSKERFRNRIREGLTKAQLEQVSI